VTLHCHVISFLKHVYRFFIKLIEVYKTAIQHQKLTTIHRGHRVQGHKQALGYNHTWSVVAHQGYDGTVDAMLAYLP